MRILYASTQEYTFELARSFREHDGWEPVYWLVKREDEAKLRTEFRNVVTHPYIDSVKGIPAKAMENMPLEVLDPMLLDKMSAEEAIALQMMERNDSHSNSFLFRERKQFYHRVLRYWLTVLKHFKVDRVVFEEEPHQASDYILYALCGQIGIGTLMAIRTVSDLGILPVERFENGCEPFIKAYREASGRQMGAVEMDERLREYFGTLRGNYEAVLREHLWDQVDDVSSMLGKSSWTERLMGKISSWFRKHLDFKKQWQRLKLVVVPAVFENDQKQKRRSIEESRQGYLELLIFRWIAIWKKRKNSKIYDSLAADDLDLSQPYVYCGLQYQPEKSTCPVGGQFVEQVLMVELLSSKLPDGWKLFVKEHPSQFVANYTRYGDFFRNRQFYERLLALPGVALVPLSYDSFTLIDSAKAVASVGGTLCWEAVVRGKPAFSFGHAWFKTCEGIFDIFSEEAIQKAMCLVQGGYLPNKNKVELFGKLIREMGFNAAVGGAVQLEHMGLSSKQNAEIHYKAYQFLLNWIGKETKC